MLYCAGQVLLIMSTAAAHKIDLGFRKARSMLGTALEGANEASSAVAATMPTEKKLKKVVTKNRPNIV